METNCSFRRKWFLAAVSVAVCLTRVWLSITWCSRMMRRAEALIGEPKDSSPTSDPANAWDKHHNHCVRRFYYHVILSVIGFMAVSWRDIKKRTFIPSLVEKQYTAVAEQYTFWGTKTAVKEVCDWLSGLTECTYKVRHKEAHNALVKSIQDCDPEHVGNIDLQTNRTPLVMTAVRPQNHWLHALLKWMRSMFHFLSLHEGKRKGAVKYPL